jgi:hypothetical protein
MSNRCDHIASVRDGTPSAQGSQERPAMGPFEEIFLDLANQQSAGPPSVAIDGAAHRDAALDEALDESFPASDPPAVV